MKNKTKSVVLFDGGASVLILLMIIFTSIATIRQKAIDDRTPECQKVVKELSSK